MAPRCRKSTDEQVGIGAWMADQPPPLVPYIVVGPAETAMFKRLEQQWIKQCGDHPHNCILEGRE